MTPERSTAKPPSDAILERLSRLHPKIIDLSLGRVERLLARLDHPEARLPPVIHVAGTNGKGSVIAYLRAVLEAAGRRVQVYTSPHLVRFHERIRLAGGLIPEAELAALLEAGFALFRQHGRAGLVAAQLLHQPQHVLPVAGEVLRGRIDLGLENGHHSLPARSAGTDTGWSSRICA